MKTKLIRNFCIFCVSVFAFITVATFSGFSQSGISIGEQIFDYGFQNTPLLEMMNGSTGLSSLDFLLRVGGIAFEAESTPETNLKNSKISISYDRTQPDGYRLSIYINQNPYTDNPFIPDWKLIPIANYAIDTPTVKLTL
ncbi:MAG: hypothetical protein QNJ55_10245 [Xenococcus sp. MO_188.B8]|nr:hypothetical protein [Xenococcus sp. MO_188.B8]